MGNAKIDTMPLSFFRFINAIIIIYLHYGLVEGTVMRSYARAGSIIIFFYMLSGFVLFLNYQRKGEIDLKQYVVKRSMGILPLYYVAFSMFAAILIYMGQFSYSGFFAALLGVQAWIPGYQHYVNPPSWFVSGLLFFYCVFPLLFFHITKNRYSGRKLLFSSMFLWLMTIVILNVGFNPGSYSGLFSNYSAFINSFPLANFCSFYMGVCGAYYISNGGGERLPENGPRSVLSTLFVLVLFFLSLTIHYDKNVSDFMKRFLPYEAGLYAPIVLLLILNLSIQKNFLTKIFSAKIFIFLGSISYALYILQAPLHSIYLKIFSSHFNFSANESAAIFIIIMIAVSSVLSVFESKTIKKLYRNS
jgi:peptidoglycan/LPS O-acetylase OafA/YrhL